MRGTVLADRRPAYFERGRTGNGYPAERRFVYHTGGFSGWTFTDLTEDMPKLRERWELEGIDFAAVYTGYLGSA